MPELPEVEIVRQSLEKKVKDKIIQKVLLRNRNLRFKIHSKFRRHILKKRIKNVDRFSKYLIIIFEDMTGFLIHLGMSGTIHLCDLNKKNSFTNTSFYHSPELPKKHNHVEIEFDSVKFIYNDPRRFGYFLTFDNNKELNKKFHNFGPEPFSKSFNLKYITKYLMNKEKNIKNFLLDQNFVSGIGNIYASEILFLSRIKPSKQANLLMIEECKRIRHFSRKVLKDAIKKGGSSIKDFKNISGKKGSFQNSFKVYGRQGLKCKHKNCTGIIQKKIITNRSTFFCNKCQT